ncbi:hypothetical protein PUNSTDRAFT_135054 [Punctularia strigosozonata HHB-11173 SS5]|uniref:uncharacterized protein n=1 Tax=Punctularia strigosozonata (strain HHB-11173) TaxID=741275 RepID=UPI0004416865|nr:uncharacterized protein PUNSTDRAFT_135054 [Punctularia strigosozonata HHB-11173 SS5]EIN08675.1 hypothetical protein PUNSTDRAFT_135054 [Punctularia strigosozonata HHB-11173 SS5]
MHVLEEHLSTLTPTQLQALLRELDLTTDAPPINQQAGPSRLAARPESDSDAVEEVQSTDMEAKKMRRIPLGSLQLGAGPSQKNANCVGRDSRPAVVLLTPSKAPATHSGVPYMAAEEWAAFMADTLGRWEQKFEALEEILQNVKVGEVGEVNR